jgi:hypothetical protein
MALLPADNLGHALLKIWRDCSEREGVVRLGDARRWQSPMSSGG